MLHIKSCREKYKLVGYFFWRALKRGKKKGESLKRTSRRAHLLRVLLPVNDVRYTGVDVRELYPTIENGRRVDRRGHPLSVARP